MAEFEDAHGLVAAANRARQAGYRQMDAYSPFPIEELAEALGLGGRGCRGLSCWAASSGGLGGFGLEAGPSMIAYPINVGAGRSTAGRSSSP